MVKSGSDFRFWPCVDHDFRFFINGLRRNESLQAEWIRVRGKDNPSYRQTINLADQLFLEEGQWKDFRDEKAPSVQNCFPVTSKTLSWNQHVMWKILKDWASTELPRTSRRDVCGSCFVEYFVTVARKMHLVSHTPKRMDHRRPSICAGKGANVITSECGLDTSYGLAHIQASCSTNRSKKIQGIPQKTRFYAVPAGFDEWRISFSMAGREILATSHDGFKAGYKWDDAVCKFGIEGLLSPIVKI